MLRRCRLLLLIVIISLMVATPVMGARSVQVEVILLVDTSDSMYDELQALCLGLEEVVDGLARRGIKVNAVVLGITEARACADEWVSRLIPTGQTRDQEDWGLAVIDLARHYGWQPDTVRLVIPLSDEGPLAGDPVSDEDERVIQEAARVARANNLVISPLLGTEFSPELEPLARILAEQTDGMVLISEEPADDLADGLHALILAAAERTREPRTVLEAITTPDDIVFDGQVISTNLVLAILMTVVLGVATAVLYSAVEAGWEALSASTLGRGVEAAIKLRQAAERLLTPGGWSHISTRPRRLLAMLEIGFFAVLTTSLGVLLQPGLNPLSWYGLRLWLGMLSALALVSLIFEGLQYWLARQVGATPAVRLRPVAPLITLASVALSRVAGFLPGFFYGRVTACDMLSEADEANLSVRRRARIILASLTATSAVGFSLWVLTLLMSLLLDWVDTLTLPTILANILINVLTAVRTLFVLGSFIALQMILFEMLPYPSSSGALIYRRSRLLWALITSAVLFVLLHTLLNPFGTVSQLLESAGLVLLILLLFLYSALAVGLWLLSVLRGGTETTNWGQDQGITVMAISLIMIWILGACAGLVMLLGRLLG